MQQFEQFRASEIYCPKCRISRPVRERLLLVLPYAELYDYRCTVCGTSCGSREVKAPPLSMPGPSAGIPKTPPSAPRAPRPARRPPRAFLG